jgi:folate-dependent phosphoribosylglycinamide formyltransferase PurN
VKKWVALFSQTGSEIYNLSKDLKRSPDVIVTNKSFQDIELINFNLVNTHWSKFLWLPKKPTVDEYILALEGADIVTLHGYLRIIPKEVCDMFNIYNLHPAPLTRYPFLKGKDPQKKIFEQKLDYGGNTIHKCTAELDSGEIILEEDFFIKDYRLDIIIGLTHKRASALWYKFLKNNL